VLIRQPQFSGRHVAVANGEENEEPQEPKKLRELVASVQNGSPFLLTEPQKTLPPTLRSLIPPAGFLSNRAQRLTRQILPQKNFQPHPPSGLEKTLGKALAFLGFSKLTRHHALRELHAEALARRSKSNATQMISDEQGFSIYSRTYPKAARAYVNVSSHPDDERKAKMLQRLARWAPPPTRDTYHELALWGADAEGETWLKAQGYSEAQRQLARNLIQLAKVFKRLKYNPYTLNTSIEAAELRRMLDTQIAQTDDLAGKITKRNQGILDTMTGVTDFKNWGTRLQEQLASNDVPNEVKLILNEYLSLAHHPDPNVTLPTLKRRIELETERVKLLAQLRRDNAKKLLTWLKRHEGLP
jgi:hypothetical protein